jgi:hypothetical protein
MRNTHRHIGCVDYVLIVVYKRPWKRLFRKQYVIVCESCNLEVWE